MSRDRAAYMREYRAKKRTAQERHDEAAYDWDAPLRRMYDEQIAALNEEVARLKRELASRPVGPTFNTRPFTPVPKR